MSTVSDTTAGQLSHMMARTLKIRTRDCFAIYEIDETNNQNLLKADERILDRVAIWQSGGDKSTVYESALDRARSGQSYFLYRVKYYGLPPADDIGGLQYMYTQAVKDVVQGRIPGDVKDCIDLAALQIQEEQGNFTETKANILE